MRNNHIKDLLKKTFKEKDQIKTLSDLAVSRSVYHVDVVVALRDGRRDDSDDSARVL